jgi:hypothetical protein
MESNGRRRRARTHIALAGLFGMAIVLASAPARAADDHWDEGKHWVSLRAGFTKSGARYAPGGSLGYGFGYTWMLARNVAWSASAGYDVLGRYGAAAQIEVPLTTEFTKHFQWTAQTRPYLGVGWGAIYHKTYRTPSDESGFRQGIYLATGANSSLTAGSVIGLDVRMMLEQDTRSINPTFPNAEASETVLSAKLSYSRTF